MKMKKSLLYVTALAFIGAMTTACSSELELAQTAQPTVGKTVILKGTVNAKKATTRSVDADGHTTWVAGEKIAVYYQKTDDSWATANATIGTPNGDGSAPITASLTDPKAGTVKLVYPATLANATGEIDNTKLFTYQVGTIADISANFDAATGTAAMTVVGSEAAIVPFTLTNQICICKFTLKNSADDSNLSATKFVISDGTNNYTVNPASPISDIVVAMLPTVSAEFTFTATTTSGDYTKTVTSATLEKGKIYTQTLKLTLSPLSIVTAEDIGKVIGADGNIYDNVTAATTAGTTACAMIAYVGNQNNTAGDGAYSIYNHGLAVALTDVSNTSGDSGSAMMKWPDAGTAASAYKAGKPSACSGWFLPSVYQWQRIFIGCGSDASFVSNWTKDEGSFSYGNFRTKMNGCGGTDVQSSFYWSSTEYSSSGFAWYYYFDYSKFYWGGKSASIYVRPVFAF